MPRDQLSSDDRTRGKEAINAQASTDANFAYDKGEEDDGANLSYAMSSAAAPSDSSKLFMM